MLVIPPKLEEINKRASVIVVGMKHLGFSLHRSAGRNERPARLYRVGSRSLTVFEFRTRLKPRGWIRAATVIFTLGRRALGGTLRPITALLA